MPSSSTLRNPHLNRGRRFTTEQRHAQDLLGLVHPAPARTLLHEVHRVLRALSALPTPLSRYQFLMHLLASDEHLFFATAQSNLSLLLPIIYTPTVGDACLNYSDLHIPLRGLWIDASHKGNVRAVLNNWPTDDVRVIVVSDCQRILGLGDLGANGMGIPVGKLLLYTACGGVDPKHCLPVVLDLGCDNPSIRSNDNYIGLQRPRLPREQYDEFIHEFVTEVRSKYGTNCLVQFEDFGNSNALRLLEKYQKHLCCFNDDIQGTASVGVAGILSSLRISGVSSNMSEHRFLFLGAGSAGIGIASLIVLALVREGVSEEDARKKCWFVDSKGLVYKGRMPAISHAKMPFAHELAPDLKALIEKDGAADLFNLVKLLKPSALIGVSTIHGAFTEPVIREMGRLNERPLIFALSNPTSKAECTAEEAYAYTNGKAIFASGSPFKPVNLPGLDNTLVPGQGNNSYIFPGVGLGVIVSGARRVTDSMMLVAADVLAALVDEEQLRCSCVYPDLNCLMDISAHIAVAVCREAVRLDLNDRQVSNVTFEKMRNLMYEPGRGLM